MSYGATLSGIAPANVLGIISPGPGSLLVSRAAAGGSRRIGLATGFGLAMAATLWAAAAAFGVAVVMTRFAVLYGVIQMAGAVYLIWLGLSPWRHTGNAAAQDAPDVRPGHPMLTGF